MVISVRPDSRLEKPDVVEARTRDNGRFAGLARDGRHRRAGPPPAAVHSGPGRTRSLVALKRAGSSARLASCSRSQPSSPRVAFPGGASARRPICRRRSQAFEQQLPRTRSDRVEAVEVVLVRALCASPALEQRRDVEAIDRVLRTTLRAGELRERRQDVDRRRELRAHGPRRDVSWPAHEAWHAHAALVGRELAVAQRVRRFLLRSGQALAFRVGRNPLGVVTSSGLKVRIGPRLDIEA